MSSAVTRFLAFYSNNFAPLSLLTKNEVLRVYLNNTQTPIDFPEFAEIYKLDMDCVKVYVTVALAQLERKKQEEQRNAAEQKDSSAE